jgi:hypothetical protein
MEDTVVELVTKLYHLNLANKTYPSYVTLRQMNEVTGGVDRKVLRGLMKDKKVTYGRTLSDVWMLPLGCKWEPDNLEIYETTNIR